MNISKKTQYILLGLLVILNITLRLPVTPHEIGIDSYHIHSRAAFISATGYADWILHPLSFFGLYPLSYPSGEIFFLSSLSQCSNTEMERVIWVIATFCGAFGVFTSYLMAKEIMHDFLFAFTVAFVYSTSRIFVTFTNWMGSTRGLFITVLPVFIWSLLKYHNKKEERLKYLIFDGGLLMTLLTIHRMVFFIPLIVIAFGVSSLLFLIGKRFKVPNISPKAALMLFFILFIPLFLLPFTPLGSVLPIDLPSFTVGSYYGYFFQGSTQYHILLNMGAEYAMAVGILIVFAPIGIIVLLLKNQKTFSDVFLVTLVLWFAPFLADPTYMIFFVLFIFSLLIGLGAVGITKMLYNIEKVRVISPLVLIVILLFSALFPYFVLVRHVPSIPFHSDYMNDLTYNAAIFIKDSGVELPRISSSIRFSPQINAFAGPPYQHSYSRAIDKIGSGSTKPISLSNLILDFKKYKNLYIIEEPLYVNYQYLSHENKYIKQIFCYETYLIIDDNYLPSDLPFFTSIRATMPKIYDNGLESIFVFQK